MKIILLALASTSLLGCIDGDLPPEEEPTTEVAKICGDHTVAETFTPSGNRITFCVDDGAEVIAEVGAHEPYEHDPTGCALDTFLALTGASTPAPARLVDACSARMGRAVTVDREVVDEPVYAMPTFTWWDSNIEPVNYCGPTGEADFANNACRKSCYPVDDNDLCGLWCKPLTNTYTNHAQYISQVLGEQGNYATDKVASCNGATRLRGLRDRGAADSGYTLLVDMDVPINQTGYLVISYLPSNGEDAFFQLRGDSYAGAWHRYTGYFVDKK